MEEMVNIHETYSYILPYKSLHVNKVFTYYPSIFFSIFQHEVIEHWLEFK